MTQVENEEAEAKLNNSGRKTDDEIKDIKLIKFIWLFYITQTLNTAIKIVFSVNDTVWLLISDIFMIVVLLCLISVVRIIIRRKLLKFVMAELLVLILFLTSILMGNAQNNIIFDFMFWATCVGIPLAISYSSIQNKELFIKYSNRYASYALMIGIIGFLFMGSHIVYVMSLAYSMLLPITILVNHLFKKFNLGQFMIVVTAILLILIYGARGPLIGIIYIIILNLYKSYKTLNYKSLTFIMATVLTLVSVLLFWNQLILATVNFLESINVYSRTLRRLASGNIFHLTGRDLLIQHYIDLIKEKPLLGWGIAGGWLTRGQGPHNALIEIILSFGVILGGIVSAVFVLSFIIPVFNRKILFNDLYTAFAAANISMLVSAGDIWAKYNLFIYVFIIMDVANFSGKRTGSTQVIGLNQTMEGDS